jgi:hypothetical protein
MDASDSTAREGHSAVGSTEYDREERLWRFIDDHADMLADMAHQAKPSNDRRLSGAEDLEHAADRWRELSREAAFYADVIDELRPEE